MNKAWFAAALIAATLLTCPGHTIKINYPSQRGRHVPAIGPVNDQG